MKKGKFCLLNDNKDNTETNPLLVVIQDQSISRKILLNYETATLINQTRAKAKVKKLFIDKLDTLFDILVCQCPIICCDKSGRGPHHLLLP